MRRTAKYWIYGATLIVASVVTYLMHEKLAYVDLPIIPLEVADKVEESLRANDVPYQEKSKGIIRVHRRDLDAVVDHAKDAANEIVPMGRSFAPSLDSYDEIIENLERKEVKYQVRTISGQRWIILPPEYKDRMPEVLFDI